MESIFGKASGIVGKSSERVGKGSGRVGKARRKKAGRGGWGKARKKAGRGGWVMTSSKNKIKIKNNNKKMKK